MKNIIKFFDKLEDKIRNLLSHWPILYAIIGGVAVVLFWRGVWETADMLEDTGVPILEFIFYGPMSTLLSSAIMLFTGLFVSFFIGDRIILSGLKNEKKVAEKTESEIKQEEAMILNLNNRLYSIEKHLEELSKKIK
jgi:Zn-dependent protease with chaperone function